MGIERRIFVFTLLLCLWAFFAQPQNISISPGTVYRGENAVITITGAHTHFAQKSNKTTVQFNCNGYVYKGKLPIISSDSVIYVNIDIPANAPLAIYKVTVHDSIDGDIVFDMFSVSRPGSPVFSTMPDVVRIGQTNMRIYASGSKNHFINSTRGLKAWLQKDTNIISAISMVPDANYSLATKLNIPANTVTGTYYLCLSDSIDSSVVSRNPVAIISAPLPYITSISPDTATQGSIAFFTVRGTSCHFLSHQTGIYNPILTNGKDTILFLNQAEFSDNAMTFNFKIPYSAVIGNYSIIINDLYDGQLISGAKINILKNLDRKIIQYYPFSAYPGSVVLLNVNTINTNFRYPSASVWLSQGNLTIYPKSIRILNTESLLAYFNIPDNVLLSSGSWNLNVKDGKDSVIALVSAFQISYPVGAGLVSASPDTIVRGVPTEIDVKGLNTNFTIQSNFFVQNLQAKRQNAVVDKVISPHEVILHINPDTSFAFGPVTLFYYDTHIGPQPLFNPLYITDHLGISPLRNSDVSDFTVFPNPFQNNFTLSYRLQTNANVTIEVLDMLGRQVLAKNPGKEAAGNHVMEIDPGYGGFKPGIYFLRLRADGSETHMKIIKAE